ncbi:porin [Marinobacteraceae bacterium S3BR75-40.1]
MVYTYTDAENAVAAGATGYNQGGAGQLVDNGSTIGVEHSHELMPGVKAFGKIELQGINTTDGTSGLDALDEAYMGVEGNFGKVWVGKDDSQYEVLIGDYSNWIYEVGALNVTSSYTTAEDNLVQYVSPSMGGLTLHAVVQIDGEADPVSNAKNYPYQLGAKYEMNNFTVALAMDSNDGDTLASGGTGSYENSYGVSFAYTLNNLVLDAYYDTRSGEKNTGNNGADTYGLMGTYTMGANSFRLSYENQQADIGDMETSVITAQVIHNLSDNMYVYTEAVTRNDDNGNDDGDTNQLNVGAAYLF